MALLYVMSDIHGETDVFREMLTLVDLENNKNKLILLGDYIGRKYNNLETLLFIKNLQEQYNDQVIVLAGNHEFMFLEDIENKTIFFNDKKVILWMKQLAYYYETKTQIFVHAGIDEEAGEYWKWGSENYYFCCKYPHTIGKFEKDIIAGHIGTSIIANDKNYHHVFWDKQSHFYIDGTTEVSGCIPLLKYDESTEIYTSFEKTISEDGGYSWQEYWISGGKYD